MSTAGLGGATVTSISSNGTTSYIAQLAVTASGGGLSAGNATTLGSSASNTAYIQFSAEL